LITKEERPASRNVAHFLPQYGRKLLVLHQMFNAGRVVDCGFGGDIGLLARRCGALAHPFIPGAST
jgi:hypothetical protein